MPEPRTISGSMLASQGAFSDDGGFEAIVVWVHRHLGMSFEGEQRAHFGFRIEGFCQEIGLSPRALARRLESGDGTLITRLAEVASTNHTFFFREGELFDQLVTTIFPTLPDGPLRFWSAAASSGDEAYSLAITARETLGLAAQRVSILGTDISERQIRFAERGLYPDFQLSEVDATRRARWFISRETNRLEIQPELKTMCTFRRFNLTARPWPFQQRFHVTFLRNVLYYFDAPTRQRVLEDCFDVTEPGGWLVTSLTEPMPDVTTRWSSIRPGVYRRARP